MEQINYLLTNRHLKDLNPLIAGQHKCKPGHKFGPAVRKYTLIHYVVSGTGTFHARGGVHTVKAGQAFLILPGETTTYEASAHDPWQYRWVGFDGELSADFFRLPPVFTPDSEIFSRLERINEDPSVAEYRLSAELLGLYASLFAAETDRNPHVQRVENYIRSTYMYPVRIEQIANQLNLDRRYLSRLFKKKTGRSMQEFLMDVRLEESTGLLRQGYSVAETAHLVGYEDVSNFSKMFKKHFGKSPSDYKN